MRYAVVKDNLVVGSITMEGDWNVPQAILVSSEEAQIGWIYDKETGTFEPAQPQQLP